MASIDSSAPETTSSDNSPTVVRRSLWLRNPGPTGPPSDSGTSGESSDSFVSNSSAKKNTLASASAQGAQSLAPPQFQSKDASDLCQAIESCSLSNQPSTSSQVTPSKCEENEQNSRPTPQLATPPRPAANCNSMSTGFPPSKSSRFKGKRAFPSIPNQPSEAFAHFMFELAKTVHSKAGGLSSSTVYFAQQPNNGQRGIHRGLQMCAFQIGLYALGLHNSVAPNWLSRTYSSHVSFITNQAIEIGAPAINFLIETWEGHLTPVEVITLADSAAMNTDGTMVATAAQLALSCLPHAHALNYQQIQRALSICEEQSHEMLEQACLAVENAAKGGCVCHEVLFIVARKWYEMYEESITPSGGHSAGSRARRAAAMGEFQVPSANPTNYNNPLPNNSAVVAEAAAAAAVANASQANFVMHPANQQATFQMLPPPSPQANFGMSMHPHYSYGYFTGISTSFAPPTLLQLAPNAVAPHQPMPPAPNFYPSVTSAAALVSSLAGMPRNNLQNQHNPIFNVPPFNVSNVVVSQAIAQAQAHAHAQAQAQSRQFQMIGQPPHPLPNDPSSVMAAASANALMQVASQQNHQNASMHAHHHNHHLMCNPHGVIHMPHQPPPPPQPQLTSRQFALLFSSYRVGMLAMETLSRLIAGYDRPHAKFARNPPYGEDVKWLLEVAKKLGNLYLQDFCASTVNAVASPFILYEIAIDVAQYLQSNHSTPIAQPFRSPTLTSLIQKSQQMFMAYAHIKMNHITQSDFEEFVGIIKSARTAYYMTPPGGQLAFNELLQSLRRSKKWRKEFNQLLSKALQTNPPNPPFVDGNPNRI